MNKKHKIIITIAVIVVAAVAGGSAWSQFSGTEEPQTESEPQTVTVSETQTQQQNETVSVSDSADSTAKATESTTRHNTTVQVTDYELPLTVREAMDALQIHYGSDYEINSTVEENGLNYFAVNYNGERFASVAVDLNTGKANETITETGATTEFSLV